MINDDTFNLGNISDVKLVSEYIKTLDDLKVAKHKKHAIEQKAKQLMTDRGSSVIQGDTKELLLQTRPVYDKDKLTPLKEILNIDN